MGMQKSSAMLDVHGNEFPDRPMRTGERYTGPGPGLVVLRGLLSSIVVLALPPGVGVALIVLASAPSWRLVAFVPALARRFE